MRLEALVGAPTWLQAEGRRAVSISRLREGGNRLGMYSDLGSGAPQTDRKEIEASGDCRPDLFFQPGDLEMVLTYSG